jgi:hypothetical protein
MTIQRLHQPVPQLPADAVAPPLPAVPLTYHPLRTMAQCRAAALLYGARRDVPSWFSPAVMQAHGTTMAPGLWPVPDGALFLTHDAMPDSFLLGYPAGTPATLRQPTLQGYTLRHCRSDGAVQTLGDLAGLQTLPMATKAGDGAQLLCATLGSVDRYLAAVEATPWPSV